MQSSDFGVSSLALYKNKEIKQYQSKNYNRQTAANRGRTRHFRRIFVYDKSIICVPRQEFLFCLICLVFCGFSHNKRVFYNEFTTFEKCSDMTKKEIVENEIFIPLYKFRNISFDFEK